MTRTPAPPPRGQDGPSFDTPNLAEAVEALPPDRIDALPFGAIRLGANGIVEVFNRTESRRSGMNERPALGFDFFADIAPCMDVPGFRGRIVRARAAGTLDLAFSHVGDFDDRTREISVRIQSGAEGAVWIFTDRPGTDPALH